jgi:dephospho-CoA kinase
MVLKIGITGGIGTGKSTVGQWLSANGVPVIDADEVVHTLLNSNTTVQHHLKQWFGEAVIRPDGTVDRPLIAQQVFNNPPLLKQLEGLLHPLVRQAISQFFLAYAHHPRACALVPLLYENATANHYDAVWVVTCSPAQQRERLKQNRGMSDEAIDNRLASQWPLAKKVALASVVIDNSTTTEALHQQLARLVN